MAVLSVQPGGGVIRRRTARVVAIVLNWNSWSDTIECVESLLASQCVPAQILICDNGSRDDSTARIKRWGSRREDFVALAGCDAAFAGLSTEHRVALIELPHNGGYAYGNNIGMRLAIERCRSEFVWILNNDTVVAPDALERMLHVADADAKIGIVGAKLLRHDRPDTVQALGGGYIIPVFCHDTQLGNGTKAADAGKAPVPLDHLVGASLLVRARAIGDVGPIDESYFLYREETDWCIRMRRAGWQLYCCPEAVVWHKQSHSIGFKSPLHDYYAVRNMLRLVWRFYPLAAPAAFAYFALRSVAPKLVRLEFVRLLAVLRAFSDFFLGVSGRGARHSDEVLLGSYVTGAGAFPSWRPKLRAAFLLLALLAGGVLLWGDSPQPPHRPIAAKVATPPQPHTRAVTDTYRDDVADDRAIK